MFGTYLLLSQKDPTYLESWQSRGIVLTMSVNTFTISQIQMCILTVVTDLAKRSNCIFLWFLKTKYPFYRDLEGRINNYI